MFWKRRRPSTLESMRAELVAAASQGIEDAVKGMRIDWRARQRTFGISETAPLAAQIDEFAIKVFASIKADALLSRLPPPDIWALLFRAIEQTDLHYHYEIEAARRLLSVSYCNFGMPPRRSVVRRPV